MLTFAIPLIIPNLRRLIRGVRCYAVHCHRFQDIDYVASYVGWTTLPVLDERMLEQFTVFWTIRFFFN